PQAVTAAELGQEYADDAAAADERYRGETLQVTGVIDEVARDGTGTWRVVLRGEEGAGGRPVECSFDGADEDDAVQLPQLQEGQPLTVAGGGGGGQGRFGLRDSAVIACRRSRPAQPGFPRAARRAYSPSHSVCGLTSCNFASMMPTRRFLRHTACFIWPRP